MNEILEAIEHLRELKDDQADTEGKLRDLVTAIQDVLGDPIEAGFVDDGPPQEEATDKPPSATDHMDYYDLPGKGIPEPLGDAPPPTRTETIREKDEDE